MGDKGGKKDKEKSQKQKNSKKEQNAKKKYDKQPKRALQSVVTKNAGKPSSQAELPG